MTVGEYKLDPQTQAAILLEAEINAKDEAGAAIAARPVAPNNTAALTGTPAKTLADIVTALGGVANLDIAVSALRTALTGTPAKTLKDLADLLAGTLTVSGTATPAAPALTATNITIANGQSESAEVDLAGRTLVGIVTPAAVEATTAQVSIKHGVVTGTRYIRQSALGTKQTIAISTTNRESYVAPGDFASLRFVSIVAETTAGVAVAQSAERVFVLLTRPA